MPGACSSPAVAAQVNWRLPLPDTRPSCTIHPTNTAAKNSSTNSTNTHTTIHANPPRTLTAKLTRLPRRVRCHHCVQSSQTVTVQNSASARPSINRTAPSVPFRRRFIRLWLWTTCRTATPTNRLRDPARRSGYIRRNNESPCPDPSRQPWGIGDRAGGGGVIGESEYRVGWLGSWICDSEVPEQWSKRS